MPEIRFVGSLDGFTEQPHAMDPQFGSRRELAEWVVDAINEFLTKGVDINDHNVRVVVEVF